MRFLAMEWASGTWIAATIAATVGLVLVYATLVLRRYVRIMVDLVDDPALLPENGNGDGGSLPGVETPFRATDGHPLSGVLLSGIRPVGDDRASLGRGTVIFAHEFGSDRSSCLRYCSPLLEAGFDVFAFDFRGHGQSPAEDGYSPRHWPSDRETADFCGAVLHLESYLRAAGRPVSIGTFGLSRGACAAILAAGRCECVDAIVADGAYSSDLAMEYFMRRFATIFARIRVVAKNHPPVFWRFLRWLLFRECERRFGCRFPSVRKALLGMGRRPILFVHGEKDSYIPFAHCQALYDFAYGPKSVWIVPGAKHNQSVKVMPAEYARRVVGFFAEHLESSTARRESRSTTRARTDEPASAFSPPSREVGAVLAGTVAPASSTL